MKVERGGFRGRLSAFLQKAMAGASKNTPAGTDRRGACAVSRAQSGARAAPPRYARPRPRAPARAMTRETGTRRKPGGGREPDRKEEPVPMTDRRRNRAEYPKPRPYRMHTSRLALYPVHPRARLRPVRRPLRQALSLSPFPHIVTPAPEPGSNQGSRCRRSRWRAGSAAEATARTEAGPRLGGRGDGEGGPAIGSGQRPLV